MASDGGIREHISELVARERAIRDRLGSGEGAAPADREELQAIEVELDQYWDLLRQRDAAREYGADPDTATVRDPGTVEHYLE